MDEKTFAERVDELLLMEQRIERKITELTQYNNNMNNKINETMTKMFDSVNNFDLGYTERLNKIQATTESAQKEARSIIKFGSGFLLVLFVIMLIASGRLFYLKKEINLAEIALAKLDRKFSQTPEIATWNGDDYIKIDKYSEMDFNEAKTAGEKVKYGTYAKVWYYDRKSIKR